jgi:hydroxyacylglutathione hydrolase
MTDPVYALTSTCWISQSRVFATNSAIFFSGGEALLVDPGITPPELEAIRAFVRSRSATVRVLVLTHAHWDHLLGPEAFPGIPILAHHGYLTVLRARAQHLRNLIAKWREEEGMVSPTSFVPPRPDYTFEQQVHVAFGAHRLQIFAAPGHAPDHCALYEPESGLLFAGDMLSDMEIPMVMHTFASYRQTLQRLARLDVRVLVPGHGTPTTDPVEISGRFAQDQAYLESVWACVGEAVARGASLDETITACAHLPSAQPDEYPNAHKWNIEQAYLEAGGRTEETKTPAGWDQDWL